MRIAILGAGALGSVIGGYLARGGHTVTLVGREAHAERIRAEGLRVADQAEFTVRPRATTDPGEAAGAELLLFTTKLYDLPAALEAAPEDVELVAGLQNGVTKDELLEERYGRDRVLGALSTVGASRGGPGVVRHTFKGITLFGSLDDGSSDEARAVASSLVDGGLRADVSDRIGDDEWTKFVNWTAGALLSCMTRLAWHRVWTSPPLAEAFVALLREASAVAEAGGHTIRSLPGLRVADYLEGTAEEAAARVLRRGARMVEAGATNIKASMLQDLEAGRRLELEETVGPLLEEARRRGVEAPALTQAYRVVRGIAAARP